MPGELPVWLLDVDGVVNARRPGWGAAPRRGLVWSAQDGQHYLIRWAPALVERIRALHVGGVLEVRWCTTWCPDAEQLERLWTLPPLRRALWADPMPRGPDCWALKQAAAEAVLAEGLPLIWSDDEALPAPGPGRDRLLADGRALLIAPRSLRGLQPGDIDQIEAFATGHADGRSDGPTDGPGPRAGPR